MIHIDAISVTTRGSFRTCRRRWLWNQEQRYPARKIPTALVYGTMMHRALAMYYSNGRTVEDLLEGFRLGTQEQITDLIEVQGFADEAVRPEIDALWQQGMDTLPLYAEYDHAVTNPPWEIVAVEQRHFVTISPDLPQLTGQIDLLVRIKGRLYIIDHKNVSRKQDQRAVDIDPQLTGYCYIVKEIYGEMPAGAMINTLLKKKPAVTLRAPKLGIMPWDSKFFRMQTERSPEAIDTYPWRARIEMQEMVDVAAAPERAYAAPGWSCPSCDYYSHCLEDLSGADPYGSSRNEYDGTGFPT